MPREDRRAIDGIDGLEIAAGDVTDIESLKSAFAGAELVYHLAGIVTIMPGMADVLWKVNVGGVRNVIEACRTAGVRRLVYTSSIHAIAEPPHGTTIDESQPFDPKRVLGDYAQSKAQATLLLLDEVHRGNIRSGDMLPIRGNRSLRLQYFEYRTVDTRFRQRRA